MCMYVYVCVCVCMCVYVYVCVCSVETMMTIGFGASDPFFKGCASMSVLITLESLAGVLLDSLCFGLIFQRLARGQNRARTIMFSRFAILQRDHIVFRVAEARKHMLVECHVRVYACIETERDGVCVSQMRVSDPDDAFGSMLFMMIPSQVCVSLHGVLSRHNRDDVALLCAWKALNLELIVVVEGIEPITSSTIMARFSFLVDDMKAQHHFVKCTSRDAHTKRVKVDYDLFHQVQPLVMEGN